MRLISSIIIHCSYTPPSMDIGVAEIRSWHVEGDGWKDIGYHFVIRRHGLCEVGRPVEIAGAHVRGHNGNSIGVCLVGGMAEGDKRPDCNFTKHQWRRLFHLVDELTDKYPGAEVLGHRDLDPNKACPTFDVKEWWG